TQRHLTRLAIDDDGYTGNDRLTDSVDFYMPMNQADLPMVDAINGVRSTRCVADKTIAPQTCPSIGDGFASNAVQLNRTSDGLKTDYAVQTSATTARSIALRVRVNDAAKSGVIAWAQAAASTPNSLALQVLYKQENKQLAVTINDQTAILLSAADSGVNINDTNWHTLIITSQGNTVNEQVMVYVDGNLIVVKTIMGHWNGAVLGMGALTGVSANTDLGIATTAAVNTAIDDLAVFTKVLTSANINDYTFGYSTVYHETFDDANAGINATTRDDSPYQQPSTITSGDTNLTRVIGTVGTAAIDFDGNDEIVHRDDNLLTFADYNQPWSVSAWVTPKTSGSTATIVKGIFNGYTYELSLNGGK
ncbi:MAG: hypothetical protein EBS29_14650, partial [Chloroflexia bacterium]|nr:hypothetical protein [Chloroflexia bacterium]